MRIIHVIQTLDPAAGGPPAVALRLAAAQASLGCEVVVAAYSGISARDAIVASTDGIPGIAKVKMLDFGAEGFMDRMTGARVYKGLGGMINFEDVVHLHGVWDPILRMAASAARRAGAAYVISPHGMLDPWSLGQKSWKKRLALALGYRRVLDDAAFVHFLNREEGVLAQPLDLKPPYEIIPNGIFIDEMDSIPEKGRTFSLSGDRPYVLFLSRLHYKKGLDVLGGAFEYAAQRDEDINLVVAGPDGGAQRDFEQRVSASGLQDRVRIVGPLYGADKYAAYRGAAVFCLPSRQEGFSMAIIEALGCGVPVVISRQCNFPEIQAHAAGKVVELNPAQMGQALLDLLADPTCARQAGERGRQLVMSHFTWPGIAERMVTAYQRQGRGRSEHTP